MPQARGSQATFGLYEETAYGANPGAPDGQLMYVKSFGVADSRNLLQSQTLVGGSRAKPKPVRGNFDAGGSIPVEIAPESIGKWLKHSLGVISTTGAGPYTHVFTIGDLPVGLMLENDYGSNITGSGRFNQYNGSRIGSAKFNFPQEGFIDAEFSIKSVAGTPAAAALDATLTDNGHNPFSMAEATIKEGGVTAANVQSCDFTLTNGLDESGYVIGNGGKRIALAEGDAILVGTVTALFDSLALLNKAINYTESSLEVTLTRGDGLGSAGSESLVFLVQQLIYEMKKPAVEGPGGLLVTLPFTSYLKGADNGLLVTLKNVLATI